MSRFPLALAYLQFFLIGGAAPINPGCRLAIGVRPELPKILARARFAPSVQPQRYGVGNALGGDQNIRQNIRNFARRVNLQVSIGWCAG